MRGLHVNSVSMYVWMYVCKYDVLTRRTSSKSWDQGIYIHQISAVKRKCSCVWIRCNTYSQVLSPLAERRRWCIPAFTSLTMKWNKVCSSVRAHECGCDYVCVYVCIRLCSIHPKKRNKCRYLNLCTNWFVSLAMMSTPWNWATAVMKTPCTSVELQP